MGPQGILLFVGTGEERIGSLDSFNGPKSRPSKEKVASILRPRKKIVLWREGEEKN